MMTWLTKPKLADQHAVVTGGARGIGAAISSLLAQLGARVTIVGRDQATLDKHLKSLGGGENAAAVRCDVSDAASVRAAFKQARQRFGDPHILVNNAGQAKSEKFHRTTRGGWDQML